MEGINDQPVEYMHYGVTIGGQWVGPMPKDTSIVLQKLIDDLEKGAKSSKMK